ncbi:flavin-containing monooxygenase [Sphingomonas sp. MMS24-JH45]
MARQPLSRHRLRRAGDPLPVQLRAQSALEPPLRPRTGDPRLYQVAGRPVRPGRLPSPERGHYPAAWNGSAWEIETEKGATQTVDAIVPALGQLSRPQFPAIPGRETFAGTQFHAAEWPDGLDLAGKRVGVIGSAASAVQFIPEVAKVAGHLTVFQRTPNWVVPRNDVAVTPEAKALMATNPEVAMKLGAAQRAMIFDNADVFSWQAFQFTPEGRAAFTRTALDHLEAQVPDADLRAKLTPDYPIGCKRILICDDFYPALMRDNVQLETAGIAAIEPGGVRTADGFHDLDVLIFATGFETEWKWSMEVIGEGGVSLKEALEGGPEAYLGIMVHRFPNMFILARTQISRPQFDQLT